MKQSAEIFVSTDLGHFCVLCFVLFVCLKQGRPTTVFCQISVRRSKDCLDFSIGRLKSSR